MVGPHVEAGHLRPITFDLVDDATGFAPVRMGPTLQLAGEHAGRRARASSMGWKLSAALLVGQSQIQRVCHHEIGDVRARDTDQSLNKQVLPLQRGGCW